MFNNRPGDAARPSSAATGKTGFSILAADLVFTGNIAGSADLHVDGRVEGDVECGTLVQGADSVIRGGVTAKVARIAGTVEGSVTADELVAEASARISGDCSYRVLTVERGASLAGKLIHAGAETPVLKVVAGGD